MAFFYFRKYCIFHPEKAERIASWVYKGFAKFSQKYDRRYIKADIQFQINDFSKKIKSEGESILPYGIKIEWIDTITPEAFAEGNDIIVKMSDHINQDKNIVTATMAYVSKGCIPTARPYIERKVLKSIDFTMVKKILMKEKRYGALDHFNNEILNPSIEQDSIVGGYCNSLNDLDACGWFTRILLNEFILLQRRVYPALPDNRISKETQDFLDYLNSVANKKEGEDVMAPGHIFKKNT